MNGDKNEGIHKIPTNIREDQGIRECEGLHTQHHTPKRGMVQDRQGEDEKDHGRPQAYYEHFQRLGSLFEYEKDGKTYISTNRPELSLFYKMGRMEP